jgi:hypothetical protein
MRKFSSAILMSLVLSFTCTWMANAWLAQEPKSNDGQSTDRPQKEPNGCTGEGRTRESGGSTREREKVERADKPGKAN